MLIVLNLFIKNYLVVFSLGYKLPENIETNTKKIKGDDGNEITIYIIKPKDG